MRFNKALEKVPKVPEKVWEASVRSQVRFNRVPERFRRGSGEVPEKVPGSQVKFNRVPEKVPETEGSGRLWCIASSSSTGF